MASALDICNLALLRIGQEPITGADDPPNLTGDDPAVVACNALYETYRDMLLEKAPWRFAKRTISLAVEDQTVDITAATQASPVVVTAPDHEFIDYKHVYIDDVEGMTELNGNTYRIANADQTAGTFELEGVDGSSYGAYTSGGTVRLRPPFNYEYEIILPSDFLRAWSLEGVSTSYLIEGVEQYPRESPYEIMETGLLINDDEIDLTYIARVTTATRFSATFAHLLSLFLAIPLAQRLADSKTLVQQVTSEFNGAFLDAVQVNAWRDNPPRRERLTSWQAAGR